MVFWIVWLKYCSSVCSSGSTSVVLFAVEYAILFTGLCIGVTGVGGKQFAETIDMGETRVHRAVELLEATVYRNYK